MNTIHDLTQVIELQQEVATSSLPLTGLMELICNRIQSLTNASGAVVEMAQADEMVYEACSGTLANQVGLRLKKASSLSGMSVAKKEVLYCRDSEIDERVNREACRIVGARSMICVPLFYQNSAVGVLKVVSPEAEKFSDREIGLLRLCAGLLSASIAQADTLQKLQHSEDKFRTLIESASDGIAISKDGVIIEANKTFCEIFGYSQEEVKGMKNIDFIADAFREEASKIIGQSDERPYELKGLRKNGALFDLEGQAKHVIINEVPYRMSTLRDISDKKVAELALKESERKSREATKTKSEFLANMSHEIRTPLNGILGMTGLLLDTNLNEQQKSYLEILRNSGDSLLSIVNDILDFSKIEAKKLTLEAIPFELRASIEDIKQLLSFSFQQKNLNFIIDIGHDVPAMVKGDPTRLRQILLNLVSNAVKFTSTGSVTVKIRKHKSDIIKFEIIDTGIGIPSHALPKMFDAFSQVDSSTTRKFGGTGLGLSICRALVVAMNGDIGVLSEEGKGSIFWFELHLPHVNMVKDSKPGQTTTAPAKKLRVLIAEDNAVNALIARKMLEKMGHNVTLAGNGLEVIEALKLAPYDVILMDCQMPEMDGFQATSAIRSSGESWKDIKIIALTAHAMSGDKEKCLAAGMDDYVSKPMKADDLDAALSRISSP